MKYSVLQKTSRYDFFLLLSVAVLALNIVSQVAAFPLQCALLIYAVIKSDIRLFPGMFILMLDKSNFKMFEAMAVKINIGFAVSPQNVFIIACFIYCICGIFRKIYDSKTLIFFVPWLLCGIPALAIALPARRLGLASVWQTPIIEFLAPSLYFWGISVAKTWDAGRDYFIKRMIIIIAAVSAMRFLRLFYVFSFAEYILMIALFAGAVKLRLGNFSNIIGAIGSLFALGSMIFLRYLQLEESQGYATGAEIGNTFTTVMVGLFGISFLIYFSRQQISKSMFKSIPYIGLIFCTCVFSYAVMRANTKVSDSALSGNYRNVLERFEYKLVGDRGVVWLDGLQDVFTPPYVFRRLEKQMVMKLNYSTGQLELAPKMPPHNQVLTLLVREGWWLGSFLILFLWWTHIRAFSASAEMLGDKAVLCTLLVPGVAVFIPVGLTGQTVLSAHFCGNGIATMVFPGIIYGIWQIRRTIYIQYR